VYISHHEFTLMNYEMCVVIIRHVLNKVITFQVFSILFPFVCFVCINHQVYDSTWVYGLLDFE